MAGWKEEEMVRLASDERIWSEEVAKQVGGPRVAEVTDLKMGLPVPGTYALVLESLTDTTVRIGRFGTLLTHPGFHVYVGSALGPGGLRARLCHHLQRAVRPHWHIDYLRREAMLVAVWYRCGRIRREHAWARFLKSMTDSSVPLAGFGSSDCNCASHLFYFPTLPTLHDLQANVLHTGDLIGSGTS